MVLALFVAICEILLPRLTYSVYLVLSLKPGATAASTFTSAQQSGGPPPLRSAPTGARWRLQEGPSANEAGPRHPSPGGERPTSQETESRAPRGNRTGVNPYKENSEKNHRMGKESTNLGDSKQIVGHHGQRRL